MEFLIGLGIVLNLVSICSALFIYLKIAVALDESENLNSTEHQVINQKLDSVLVKAKSVDPDEKWGNLKNAFSTGRPNERS